MRAGAAARPGRSRGARPRALRRRRLRSSPRPRRAPRRSRRAAAGRTSALAEGGRDPVEALCVEEQHLDRDRLPVGEAQALDLQHLGPLAESQGGCDLGACRDPAHVISFEPGTIPRARISSVWLVRPSRCSIFARATNVPLPWRRWMRCSASRRWSACRTVARETPNWAPSSRSVGRAAPSGRLADHVDQRLAQPSVLRLGPLGFVRAHSVEHVTLPELAATAAIGTYQCSPVSQTPLNHASSEHYAADGCTAADRASEYRKDYLTVPLRICMILALLGEQCTDGRASMGRLRGLRAVTIAVVVRGRALRRSYRPQSRPPRDMQRPHADGERQLRRGEHVERAEARPGRRHELPRLPGARPDL